MLIAQCSLWMSWVYTNLMSSISTLTRVTIWRLSLYFLDCRHWLDYSILFKTFSLKDPLHFSKVWPSNVFQQSCSEFGQIETSSNGLSYQFVHSWQTTMRTRWKGVGRDRKREKRPIICKDYWYQMTLIFLKMLSHWFDCYFYQETFFSMFICIAELMHG